MTYYMIQSVPLTRHSLPYLLKTGQAVYRHGPDKARVLPHEFWPEAPIEYALADAPERWYAPQDFVPVERLLERGAALWRNQDEDRRLVYPVTGA